MSEDGDSDSSGDEFLFGAGMANLGDASDDEDVLAEAAFDRSAAVCCDAFCRALLCGDDAGVRGAVAVLRDAAPESAAALCESLERDALRVVDGQYMAALRPPLDSSSSSSSSSSNSSSDDASVAPAQVFMAPATPEEAPPPPVADGETKRRK